jgi:predicted N-acetyltransferase YhbS
MTFHLCEHHESNRIGSLFQSVFRDSEGEEEGALVGDLARTLLKTTDPHDLFVFVASEGEEIAGCIIATRMPSEKESEIFLIAPVAVLTNYQGRGIGQGLLKYGIAHLKAEGAKMIMTYGDPSFYSKVGFSQVTCEIIEPPFPLSQPEGWLMLTSDGQKITTSLGRCSCVPAFNHPGYW